MARRSKDLFQLLAVKTGATARSQSRSSRSESSAQVQSAGQALRSFWDRLTGKEKETAGRRRSPTV